MKTFNIDYTITIHSLVEIEAETEEEAREELNRIYCNDEPIYKDNSWIDNDILLDGGYSLDIDSVVEERG